MMAVARAPFLHFHSETRYWQRGLGLGPGRLAGSSHGNHRLCSETYSQRTWHHHQAHQMHLRSEKRVHVSAWGVRTALYFAQP
jgi:hypothetical protein